LGAVDIMKVLLTGQGGFIGSRLRAALLRRGHEVPPSRVDFRIADTPDFWLPHLAAVDVVINAAGIFRERRPGGFDLVNERAPCALFRAAAKSDVGLIIQFSALGADEAASSRFHLSKRAADECLRSVPVPSYSLQPSLVFGEGGASARLLEMLASLPLIPLPGDGRQRIQPIHVDDLVDAVIVLVESTSIRIGRTIALVGPREISLRDYLAVLRESLGLPAARFIEVPMRLARRLARVAAYLSSAPLDPEALEMLERDNVADARDTEALLGHPPRPPHRFVPPALAPALRTQATMQWLLPVLRISIAVMWIWSAIVSVALYPLADSYRLLAAVGVPAALAPLALYGAAACDLVLGALTLLLRRRHLLWQVQIVLILVYTVIIAIRLPEYLVHPFGPIVKNLPILALLWMLMELEPKQRGPQTWNT
jgi:uncharacterized protein YbjT (DUF2867 family)